MKLNKKKIFMALLYCFLLSIPLFASNLSVPSLILVTRGAMESGNFVLRSSGRMDMIIEGGYKFGGEVVLGFDSNDIESLILNPATGGLFFRSASVIIRDIFNIPLSLMYFIGRTDEMGYGDGFSRILEKKPARVSYSGFLYFPDWPTYRGIHTIGGTGFHLLFTPVKNVFYIGLYGYQDAYLSELLSGPGRFSYDLRTLLDFDNIKIESFIGASYPAENYGYYRAGLLFYAQAGPAEFLTQLGIPKWDPVSDQFGLELFFFLLEVRLGFNIVSVVTSVFIHPKYYLQKLTSEAGKIDLNLNIQLGNLEEGIFAGGIEGNIRFQTQTTLSVKTAAYIKLVTPGVVWTLKACAKLAGDPDPWTDLANMFEGFAGIEAEF